MSLYQKLILFMLAAALGPLAVVGFSLLSAAEQELKARIGSQQSLAAASAAQMAARDVDEAVESLVRSVEPIPWGRLSADERLGALRLVYQQSKHFAATALLDAKGKELLPIQARSGEDAVKEGRIPMTVEELPAFRAAIPLAALEGSSVGAVAMSPVYVRPRARASAAAVALAIDDQDGRAFVAAEISLAAIQRRAEELSASGAGALFLLDAEGHVVAGPTQELLLKTVPAAELSGVRQPGISRYLVDGVPMLAASAKTPGMLGWTAVVRLPESEAFASVARMRRTVLASIGFAFLLLLVAGFLFTRGLTRGIERVTEGARAYGKGDLSVRIPVVGADEMSELAFTFNAMGTELYGARKKLETWNEELQQKVEERTAELKAAQVQLVESQKLAAIGQLGAGVAHEINNPLAGILGNVQLLLLDRAEDDRDGVSLRKIEQQAKRAKEITSNLLRFSQHKASGDLRPVDLNKVVTDALSLVESQVRSDGVEVLVELASGLPKVKGDASHLSQVVLNLVANSRTAMLKSPQKRLTLRTVSEGGTVQIRVVDTGKGIPEKNLTRIFEPFFTTKDVWTNVGLGLSVSYRIVSEHGGRLVVASREGEGATFTVDLPKA